MTADQETRPRQRTHSYAARLEWTGDLGSGTSAYNAYSRNHRIDGDGKPPLLLSSDPLFRGDPDRWSPEELLVASLSSCHMLWFLHLCADAGIIVTGYVDDARGTMVEQAGGTGQFAEVVLRPVVTLAGQADVNSLRALHGEAHERCFIARSVNFPVRCEPSIVGVAAGQPPASADDPRIGRQAQHQTGHQIMKGIQIQEPGGPEALRYVELEERPLGPGEARVRVTAIGVNFLDVYHRSGLYPVATPFTPGSEAAGVVEEVGADVSSVAVGDRVVYSALGAYAESAVVPEARLIPLPPEIDDRTAAAAFLQGLTAHYLVNSTYPLRAGEWALVHAAAGGVGGLLVQMARQRGANVIGTASTSKVESVRDAGADLVIDYTSGDFVTPTLEATKGHGVDVVYDSVGRTTFDGSLEVLRTRGMLVCFGQSSGPILPVDILRLGKKGVFLTRPGFPHYTTDTEELRWRSQELFDAIRSGLQIRIDRELPLSEAAEAHRLLEGRQTAGKLLLIP